MSEKYDIAEAAAQWLEKSGYKGELSALTAGIHDISEGVGKIQDEWIPLLLKLDPAERDESLTLIIDLLFEMEHIRDHAESAYNTLIAVRDFLDESLRSEYIE